MTESNIPQVLCFSKTQIIRIYNADDFYEIDGVKYWFVIHIDKNITGVKFEGYTPLGVLYITDGTNVYKTDYYEYNEMKSGLHFKKFSYLELDTDYKLPKKFKK